MNPPIRPQPAGLPLALLFITWSLLVFLVPAFGQSNCISGNADLGSNIRLVGGSGVQYSQIATGGMFQFCGLSSQTYLLYDPACPVQFRVTVPGSTHDIRCEKAKECELGGSDYTYGLTVGPIPGDDGNARRADVGSRLRDYAESQSPHPLLLTGELPGVGGVQPNSYFGHTWKYLPDDVRAAKLTLRLMMTPENCDLAGESTITLGLDAVGLPLVVLPLSWAMSEEVPVGVPFTVSLDLASVGGEPAAGVEGLDLRGFMEGGELDMLVGPGLRVDSATMLIVTRSPSSFPRTWRRGEGGEPGLLSEGSGEFIFAGKNATCPRREFADFLRSSGCRGELLDYNEEGAGACFGDSFQLLRPLTGLNENGPSPRGGMCVSRGLLVLDLQASNGIGAATTEVIGLQYNAAFMNFEWKIGVEALYRMQSLNPTATWAPGTSYTFFLDLGQLPIVGGAPYDMIPTISNSNTLDVHVASHTITASAEVEIHICPCDGGINPMIGAGVDPR